jgi:hypothetical protein
MIGQPIMKRGGKKMSIFRSVHEDIVNGSTNTSTYSSGEGNSVYEIESVKEGIYLLNSI